MKKYLRLSKQIQNNLEILPDIKSKNDLLDAIIRHSNLEIIWPSLPNAWIKPKTQDEWERFLLVKNSWQLTIVGAIILQRLYQSYVARHPNNAIANGRALINLSEIFNGPWHWQGDCIYIWNQETYFELAMFDGDIKQLLDFHKPKNN